MPDPTKRIYLAGPMQGIPKFNYPRFQAVAYGLRQGGHQVFSPAEANIRRMGGKDLISKSNAAGTIADANKLGFSLRQALAEDTAFICLEANCIGLLPGWEKSHGCQAEHRLAAALLSEGMEIVYLPEALCHQMECAYNLMMEEANAC